MRIINFVLISVALLCAFQQATAKTSHRLVLADSLKNEQSFPAAQSEKKKDEETEKVQFEVDEEEEQVIVVKPEEDVEDLPVDNNKLLAERETNLGENGYDQDSEDNEKADLEEVFESRAQRRRRTRGGNRRGGRRGNRNRRARRGRPNRRGLRTRRGGNRRFRRTG